MGKNNSCTEYFSSRLQERYIRARHRSGLTVCVIPRKSVTAYAVLGVNCGSIHNQFRPAGAEHFITVPDGTAHFLEHKLFAEPNGEDVTNRFAKLGTTPDAYTTPDATAYLFSGIDNIKESLAVLLDFVTHPYFTDENVERERGIIEQELRMYEDTPSQLGYYNLMEALYHNHPIRINVGGSVQSIRSITKETLYTFYHAFYRLSEMTLVIAGNITPEEVLAVCDAVLPDSFDAPCAERAPICEPPHIVRPMIRAKAQVAVPLVYLGVKEPEIDPDPVARMKKAAAVDIANDILFSNASKFFNDMYSEGLINARFGADFELSSEFSYVMLSAETSREEEFLDRVKNYIAERQQKHDITKAQFERCKRVMYACAVTAFESSEEIAGSCLSLVMDGGEMFADTDIMAELKIDDMFDALDSVYDPDRMAVSVVDPLDDDPR
ncbi:MAG: insulinase family protein [Clostridia bacterium]|nr:insulinase family protein [Clostridia bacterium]